MSIVEEIKESFRKGTALTRLIYVNTGVFIGIALLGILRLFGAGFQPALWLSVPSDFLSALVMPWTYFSYMFLHTTFLHFIFNILYLYWFGKIFLQFFNQRQLLGVYLLGGLSGAFLFQIGYNYIPALNQYSNSSILMGASASVMAVLFSVARYAPEHTIYLMFLGPVKLKYIALGAFLIDLISMPSLNNTGGHIAHIGGALWGLLYASRYLKGKDMTRNFNRVMDSVTAWFKPSSKLKVTHKRPMSDYEYNNNRAHQQHELDRILEKIKSSGYESLTKEEKKTLFDASQKQ